MRPPRERARRGSGRAAAPDHRQDGRPLRAGGGRASRTGSRRSRRTVFSAPRRNPLRDILGLKADIASLRRVTLPQRDAVGRLSRREFPQIPETMTYRFRDVYDQLVRLTDEAIFLQDRVTGLLDAHLSTQSNRLNQVMKVLTVIATIFMPLTVLTGMYGMNVRLPQFPGGRGCAVLVDLRHHGSRRRAPCCGRSGGRTGCEPDPPPAAGPRQPDRGGRGRRAARVGREGTGRERHRRRRAPRHHSRGVRRQEARLRGRRRGGHDAGGSGTGRRAARDEQDPIGVRPRRDRDTRVPGRGAAVDRVGVALPPAHAGARRVVGDRAHASKRDGWCPCAKWARPRARWSRSPTSS